MAVLLSFGVSANEWRRVGESSLSVLFWDVYDARLFSEDGRYDGISGPLKLTLTYHRKITATELVDSTREQWQGLDLWTAANQAWLARMKDQFPTVNDSDTLSFELAADNSAKLYYNQALLVALPAAQSNRDFLAIWLSPSGAYPKFTRRLIGNPKT